MKFLAPRSDEFVRIDEFIVVVGIPAETGKTRLFIDDKEIDGLQRAAATVSFIPGESFTNDSTLPGPHSLTVKRYGEYADLIEEQSLLVYLVKEDTLSDQERSALLRKARENMTRKKPAKYLPFHNGRVAVWFEYETFIDTGKTTGEADVWGNGGIGDFKYDYNLTLRTDEKSEYQTLQRFRGAVSYRSIARLSMGDNWPAYHQAILQQQLVRGMEINLKTPKNRIGLDFVWGKTHRAIDPFVVNDSALSASSTHNDSAAAFSPGTFARQLQALRLTVDIPRLLNVSITACKARDDTASMDQLMLVDTTVNDTFITGRTPMDNFVYGADAHLSLLRGKAQLFGSFAMSWLTKDISGGPISREDMESYFSSGFNLPHSGIINRFFIFNETTVPLPIPIDSTQTVNGSSLAGAMNWDAGLRLNLPFAGTRNRADVKYYYIGPNFASLGNQFLSVDRAGWLVNAQTTLLEGKLFFKGKMNLYHKDLFEITGTPTKVIQSTLTGSLNLQHYLPTVTILGSVNSERARTAHATDPDRENMFYTIGGSVQYSPVLGAVQPTLHLSYYNSATEIKTKDLVQPFSMRTHTLVANLTSPIADSPVEPCVSFSMNRTTDDIPLRLIAVSGGTRVHIVPKVFLTDFLVGYSTTDDPLSEDSDHLSLKTAGRYELSERHSLWFDAGLKWDMKDVIDRRFKLNYELRY